MVRLPVSPNPQSIGSMPSIAGGTRILIDSHWAWYSLFALTFLVVASFLLNVAHHIFIVFSVVFANDGLRPYRFNLPAIDDYLTRYGASTVYASCVPNAGEI